MSGSPDTSLWGSVQTGNLAGWDLGASWTITCEFVVTAALNAFDQLYVIVGDYTESGVFAQLFVDMANIIHGGWFVFQDSGSNTGQIDHVPLGVGNHVIEFDWDGATLTVQIDGHTIYSGPSTVGASPQMVALYASEHVGEVWYWSRIEVSG